MSDSRTNSREHPRSVAFPYLVCGALAVGVVGVAATESRQDLERAERTLQVARGQIMVVARAEEVADDMRRRIGELRADLHDYTHLDTGSMTDVLAAVVDALPEDVVLDGIRLDQAPGGVRAEIAGFARTATALAGLRDNLDRAFASARIAPYEARDTGQGEPFLASFTIDTIATAQAGVAP